MIVLTIFAEVVEVLWKFWGCAKRGNGRGNRRENGSLCNGTLKLHLMGVDNQAFM